MEFPCVIKVCSILVDVSNGSWLKFYFDASALFSFFFLSLALSFAWDIQEKTHYECILKCIIIDTPVVEIQ